MASVNQQSLTLTLYARRDSAHNVMARPVRMHANLSGLAPWCRFSQAMPVTARSHLCASAVPSCLSRSPSERGGCLVSQGRWNHRCTQIRTDDSGLPRLARDTRSRASLMPALMRLIRWAPCWFRWSAKSCQDGEEAVPACHPFRRLPLNHRDPFDNLFVRRPTAERRWPSTGQFEPATQQSSPATSRHM